MFHVGRTISLGFGAGLIGLVALNVRPFATTNQIEREVDPDALARLLAEIRPQPGEDLFDSIPWQISLHEARVKAAREGKPILLWEMDGHPLGCG